MARENRKASFAFALQDSGSNLHTYKGVRKYGIELEVLQSHKQGIATAAYLAALQLPGAVRIYTSLYWKYPGCDALSSGLDYFVFDTGLVCGGPRVATNWLNLLAGPRAYCHDDAIAYANEIGLEAAISGIEFYRRRRFKAHPLWPVLGAEWTNRTNRAKQRALRLGASGPELPNQLVERKEYAN